MEGFVGEEEFEFDVVFNREPVEVLENKGDVVSGRGVGQQWAAELWTYCKFLRRFEGDSVQ